MQEETTVEPWVTTGSYDETGRWYPRYVDAEGNWNDGWGWFDEGGNWCVARGYYEPDGSWSEVTESEEPDRVERDDDAAEPDETLPIYVPGYDRELSKWVATSAVTHGVMLLLAFTMPDAAGALELDGYAAKDRFVQLALTDMQEEPEPVVPGWDGGDEAPEAAKHAGEEGKAGDRDASEARKRLAIKGPAVNEDLEIARARDKEIAMNAGIARQISTLWASADRSIGSDAVHAMGNLDGDEPGDARGFFGLGIRGGKPGGGGHNLKGIGIGSIDTSGLSGVNGSCRGFRCGGEGRPDLGDKGSRAPKAEVVPQRPHLTGGLDREIVQRVVRQHRQELKACYEAELQKNRKLGGELVVKFTISGDGNVIAAVGDGGSLGSKPVERCVTNRIRRWVFPRQDGMGLVVVRYPFRFSNG